MGAFEESYVLYREEKTLGTKEPRTIEKNRQWRMQYGRANGVTAARY